MSTLSIWGLIFHEGIIVQIVMLILVACSIWTWSIIFYKSQTLRLAHKESIKFENVFWESSSIVDLHKQLKLKRNKLSGMKLVFFTSFRDFLKLNKNSDLDGKTVIEGVERSYRVAMSQEVERLEKNISTLGTIGAIAPYIGLLGTVWGIMGSFASLAGANQTSLSVVAPHIAQALIATALGLVVAIPAVVSYNYLVRSIDRVALRYENFQDDFCILLYSEAFSESCMGNS